MALLFEDLGCHTRLEDGSSERLHAKLIRGPDPQKPGDPTGTIASGLFQNQNLK